MKLHGPWRAPALITGAVLALVALARVAQPGFLERLERLTYDQRVRLALRFPAPVATNLGFVFMSDESIAAVKSGELGYRFGLYWPRQVYGRLIEELATQGAEVVAMDVLFGELREDHPSVHLADGQFIESDEYFAHQLRRAGNVILATTPELEPPPLFATNAAALGDISTDKDPDGSLRRARLFRTYRRWHPLFKQVEADPGYGIDLRQARCEPGRIVLPRANGEEIVVPVDEENRFDLADFVGEHLPPGTPRKARAFTEERVWHMGVVLAARALGLDLDRAQVDLRAGRVLLRSTNGLERIIPLERDGTFWIDWCLPPDDPRLAAEPVHRLLWQHKQRLLGQTNGLSENWRGRLAVIGSSAQGNDLTDRGITPIAERETLLVSKHWNVANSILTGRFVRRSSLGTDLALLTSLAVLTAMITWRWRAFTASGAVALLALLYAATAAAVYVHHRYWLPIVLPIGGAMLLPHGLLVTYRVVFEERERRRVKHIFSKVVSPEVVNELLQAETLSLGGTRREVTVLFADVRGFTELTDRTHERVAEYVSRHGLSPRAAEACYEEFARELLATVNLYLSAVADAVKAQGGTLDKYIGDCVMAFWGAPQSNPHHAVACVRAAMDAQRRIHELNQRRAAENPQRELENRARAVAGLPPRPLLPTLALGTGINTGTVTVGLMGSDAHLWNYTIFGREVNLASRLEGVSGRGRIIISETTYQHLQRDDPALAATCVELEPVTPKGFNRPIRIFEVPWLPPEAKAESFQTLMIARPDS
ncbi:MAG: adenylate/guanylate cyclase domain-containing protein [Verrucomicrobiae bacterium]|nr:adenylate/guanylate cyclase domain-containing protein [Verrucomicrobiae bacterium]